VLIGYLLWRVETIKELTAPTEEEVAMEDNTIPETTHDDIEPLLQKYCVDTQLYLQPDLTVTQLAQAIGSNRTYLGQYFSRQDTTYNAYINNLRIHHFINLYREAVAAQRPFTAQQLASDSGYRSYSTFSLAFKQRMGQSVTAWMHDTTA
jgi:AraC-like DNA-binding protein